MNIINHLQHQICLEKSRNLRLQTSYWSTRSSFPISYKSHESSSTLAQAQRKRCSANVFLLYVEQYLENQKILLRNSLKDSNQRGQLFIGTVCWLLYSHCTAKSGCQTDTVNAQAIINCRTNYASMLIFAILRCFISV